MMDDAVEKDKDNAGKAEAKDELDNVEEDQRVAELADIDEGVRVPARHRAVEEAHAP